MLGRRDFLRVSGALTLNTGCSASRQIADPRPPSAMVVGMQEATGSDDMLQYLAQFGVEHICGSPPRPGPKGYWLVDDLKKLRDRVESFGLHLDMLPLPLSSWPIARSESPHIMLGKSPERDREIDTVSEMIRAASRAGIPALKYNLTLLGVVRTGHMRGRGGSSYSAFDYEKSNHHEPIPDVGRVGADEMWERITYFLKRVIPVAEEYKVRMACHPHDPPMPPEGYRGVVRVLGSVEGLKRFIDLTPSPYHGLNFCQGTISEGLYEPGKQIYDVIRYFGARKKIFNVHFRNIRGNFLKFQEVYPDEGDVDMLRAMCVYKEVGYDGMVMPDHAPQTVGDEHGRQAFAFAFGYIKALIQAVSEL